MNHVLTDDADYAVQPGAKPGGVAQVADLPRRIFAEVPVVAQRLVDAPLRPLETHVTDLDVATGWGIATGPRRDDPRRVRQAVQYLALLADSDLGALVAVDRDGEVRAHVSFAGAPPDLILTAGFPLKERRR